MNQFKMKVGTFTGAAAALNLDLGFIPDSFRWRMGEAIAATNVAGGEWDSGETDAHANVDIAIVDNGTATQVDKTYITSNGITKLDVVKKAPDIWKLSTVYAVGDIVHPTVNNGYYYKCTTAGTSHSSEPTWLTVVGGTTSEGGGTVVWTCYKQGDLPVSRGKQQGVTIGTGCMTNAKVYRYVALRGN